VEAGARDEGAREKEEGEAGMEGRGREEEESGKTAAEIATGGEVGKEGGAQERAQEEAGPLSALLGSRMEGEKDVGEETSGQEEMGAGAVGGEEWKRKATSEEMEGSGCGKRLRVGEDDKQGQESVIVGMMGAKKPLAEEEKEGEAGERVPAKERGQ
jgi:hypothetical protein